MSNSDSNADAYSYTYVYILNSKKSDTSINIGYANPGAPQCDKQYGGMQNVCGYAVGVLPGKWVKYFPNPACTLFALATQVGTPSGTWTLESCKITMNKATGEVFVAPWSGPPTSADADADGLTEHTDVKRARKGRRGAGAEAAAG